MSETASTYEVETASLQARDGILSEKYVQEARSSVVVDSLNSRINDYISNGMLPEQIEKRITDELQNPESQQKLIAEFSPYSDHINSYVKTTDELSVYTENGLLESRVGDRACLQMKVDANLRDANGRSNPERMALGRAPIDDNGDSINLHHIGQKEDSPLAELPDRVHKEYDAALHDKSLTSEVHGVGNNWSEERSNYWRERSKDF